MAADIFWSVVVMGLMLGGAVAFMMLMKREQHESEKRLRRMREQERDGEPPERF